ncbi:DUF2157 domain-containing protein [Microseira sp. BLCC-F43]|uniref:DUF2157 domain-containing protein n=1 Tax=Microseira sp. BLCC-F43 TaxID=3153602 RepID=UPI0035BA0508
MVSDKFRHQLRQEAEQWKAEGLIDAWLYEQLSERYQFNTLDTSTRNRFIVILIGLGSLLLGLAVITLVAANWQVWSRELRVTLLLSLFIGVNAIGFYLWRRPADEWQHRIGHGVLLLGALILGANMALMAQMFHQSGSPARLFLVWGLGVLAMAYSLRLTVLGMLSVLLMGIGYWWGFFDWFPEMGFSWMHLMLQHMPILAGLMFVPLAYWCRSRWLFGMGAIAIISSLEANLTRVQIPGSSVQALVAAIAFALPPALLWAYDDRLWRSFNVTRWDKLRFQPIARNLALLCLGILFYLFSFRGLWPSPIQAPGGNVPQVDWVLLLDAAILACLTLWEWVRLVWRMDLTTAVVGGLIAIAAIVPWWHISIAAIQDSAVWIFNIALFILAAGLVREGLSSGQRRGFWGGMILLTLQIFSRMLEYDTDLLFKAFILFLCGVGVIVAGLWFERYVRTLHHN